MGVGAAGVALATSVRSVPAFAYDAPTETVPFVMYVEGDTSPMSVVLQPGQATCPGSAVECTGCGAGIAEPRVLEATLSVIDNVDGANWGWGADAATALLPANDFTNAPKTKSVDPVTGDTPDFSKVHGSSLRDPAAGDTLLLRGRAVYRCTYSDGHFEETITSQALVFTFDGAAWQSSPYSP
jgi:hypothetical protein